ncbi:hypothetical protein AAHA92_17255 [Salvia divinorum]|uniref:TF-B3 domain-containing protein n=1 Tax=Salvia divinorum TaxID=28513 RepID=A0ABD1H290_SALDI
MGDCFEDREHFHLWSIASPSIGRMTTIPVRDYPRSVKPSFCKVICGHDAYLRMRFPEPWFEFYGADLSSPVKLEMSNGVKTTVGITNAGHEAFLDECWESFVYTHSIEVSDTLVFTHQGGPDFKILRYKANGCMPDLDVIHPDARMPLGNRLYRPWDTESEDSDLEPQQLQSNFTSTLPAFTCVLMASDLDRGLNLPNIWWKTHVEDTDSVQSVTFWVGDDTWIMYVQDRS